MSPWQLPVTGRGVQAPETGAPRVRIAEGTFCANSSRRGFYLVDLRLSRDQVTGLSVHWGERSMEAGTESPAEALCRGKREDGDEEEESGQGSVSDPEHSFGQSLWFISRLILWSLELLGLRFLFPVVEVRQPCRPSQAYSPSLPTMNGTSRLPGPAVAHSCPFPGGGWVPALGLTRRSVPAVGVCRPPRSLSGSPQATTRAAATWARAAPSSAPAWRRWCDAATGASAPSPEASPRT